MLECVLLLSKRDPNTGLINIAKFFKTAFYRTSTLAASKGLHDGFFTGKFPDSEKFYQQLELEYLNQRR